MPHSRLPEVQRALAFSGWALHWLDGDNHADLCSSLARTAMQLGEIVPGRSRKVVEILKPVPVAEAYPRSISAVVGAGVQPWHTDLAHQVAPARLVLLACLEPGEIPVATELCDGPQQLPASLRQHANCEPFLVRSGRQAFYSTVFDESFSRLRFDPGCMTSATPSGIQIEQVFSHCVPSVSITLARGQLLLIDNWRMLHRRQDAAKSAGRVMARAYVIEEQ